MGLSVLDAGAGRDVEGRDSLELAAGLEFWMPAQGEMWRGLTALSSPPGLMMMALTWFPRVLGLNMPVENYSPADCLLLPWGRESVADVPLRVRLPDRPLVFARARARSAR